MAIQTVIATINGQQVSLQYNVETGKYEGTAIAPNSTSFHQDGGYYPVSITATDTAGNEATADAAHAILGQSLRLVVKERVKPAISIVTPGAGAIINTGTPQIKMELRDEAGGSGINLAALSMRINSGAALGQADVTATPVSGGYDITYTPTTALHNGANNITADVSDNDGNAADTAGVSFTVNLSAPTLDITAPVDGLVRNNAELTIQGVVNDDQMTSVVVTATLNGVDVGDIAHDQSAGTFSKVITLTEGGNTIEITATDAGGLTSTITRTVTLDTAAPVFVSVNIAPNPADAGATYTITVEVTD